MDTQNSSIIHANMSVLLKSKRKNQKEHTINNYEERGMSAGREFVHKINAAYNNYYEMMKF